MPGSDRVPAKVLNTVNLWMKEGKKHDKVYRLEVTEQPGAMGFDVFCMYGRRGSPLRMHIWYSGPSYSEARTIFDRLWIEKVRKGYREIKEDALEVSKHVYPTRSY